MEPNRPRKLPFNEQESCWRRLIPRPTPLKSRSERNGRRRNLSRLKRPRTEENSRSQTPRPQGPAASTSARDKGNVRWPRPKLGPHWRAKVRRERPSARRGVPKCQAAGLSKMSKCTAPAVPNASSGFRMPARNKRSDATTRVTVRGGSAQGMYISVETPDQKGPLALMPARSHQMKRAGRRMDETALQARSHVRRFSR